MAEKMKTMMMLLLLMTVAHAEEAQKLRVFHEDEAMSLVVQPDGRIEISYITLPPILREAGANVGQVLVQGKWNKDVMEGTAYAFVHGCEPISYPVRGVVSRETGILFVIGPMPTSCTDRTLVWKEGSVMTFDQPRTQAVLSKQEKEKKKEKVAKAKPKPKPRSVSPYTPYEYNWREQWRW